MEILIGKITSYGIEKDNEDYVIEFPSLGIIRAQKRRNLDGFDCVYLNRKNLIALRDEIDRELNYEKSYMERHSRCNTD
jgi:hypothetical protein